MAPPPPDTSALTSASQVFQSHRLPEIRAIHKALHAQVDDKSARLRSQVGGSYRELLGTADAIVRMRGDMREAQAILGRMGAACGRGAVDGKVGGLRRFRETAPAEEARDRVLGRAARARLLRAGGLAVGRLLKKGAGAGGDEEEEGRGDRMVLAAKVFVLSRLLLSGFGDLRDVEEDIRTTVEAARKSLDRLRRRLIRAVEKVLQKVGEEVDTSEIVKALSAYSLASSSGTKDVLRRFLHIRAEAIAYEFDVDEHEKQRTKDNVLRGIGLYTRTLLDVQALIPNKLPDALSNLKKKPLLADESLRGLEGLRLDVYERWCGDEIRYFTPFIRHDDLDGKQAREMLMSWAKNGEKSLLQGLGKTLEQISEFRAIVELRTSVLQQWVKDGGKARGFDPSDMLDGLRRVINDHLLQLLEAKVTKLRLVGSEVAATLQAWKTGETDQHRSIWDEEVIDADMSGGASNITHEIISRLYGRNDAVSRAITGFVSWHHIIDNVGDLVEQLRRQRWDNDVDEIEDEEIIEARQKLLSEDDPELLRERLNAVLETAFRELDGQLTAQWEAQRDGVDNGEVAMYILRILRDIRSKLPKLDGVRTFGLSNVSSLHEKLAAHVSIAPIEEFSATALTRKRVAGRALWEGEPALPTQPSPGAFKLLRNLIMTMGDAGLDLWTPAAVKTLKQIFCGQLVGVWRKELDASSGIEATSESASKHDGDDDLDEAETNAATPADSDTDSAKLAAQRNDVLAQWLYDARFLEQCLQAEGNPSGLLEEFAQEIAKKTDLDSGSKERLVKASQDYWKRTSLLFGLLA
ncbi:hypothetical protein F5Y15DRAFT_425524 [Xylariaceae sp. FL0016]|nr:hypothetical protein F5Y15DRAFT_425524 [Xylariaceae sp. FL0016]